MAAALFWLLSIVAVLGALGVVASRRSALGAARCLALSMAALTGLFLLLRAPLVGLAQLLLHAALMVFVFALVIAIARVPPAVPEGGRQPLLRALGALAVAFFAARGAALLASPGVWEPAPPGFGETRALAVPIYADHVLAFQLSGALLLAAVLAATVMTRRRSGS